MRRETREGDYYCREMQTPCGIYRKLEAFENIGLEPEEVLELKEKQDSRGGLVEEKTVREIIELLAKKKKEYIGIIHGAKDSRTEETYKRYLCGMNVFLDAICAFARKNKIDVSDIEW